MYGGGVFSLHTLTTTPQPGEVWEFTFDAKLVSGSQGDGFMVSFRADADDNAAVSDEARIMLNTDDDWHTYTAYVTINENAYAKCDRITPYFGWTNSTEAGTVRVGGVTARKVGNQWNNAAENLGLKATINSFTAMETVEDIVSPIAYEQTVKLTNTNSRFSWLVNLPNAACPQPEATNKWTLSFWAKSEGTNSSTLCMADDTSASSLRSVSLSNSGEWQYVTERITAADLSAAAVYFTVSPQSTLYLNGISLVPGDVALAHESGQNSAALKNITRTLGNTANAVKFNTAIEYDTDENRTSYSRIKHYINDGEAIGYEYDEAGNIS